MKSIGIDIGTTTISIVVMDHERMAVEQKYTVKNKSFLPSKRPWEKIQDTDLILAEVNTLLEQITNTYPHIASIGLTGQMHGIVYVNKDGKAVSPLYTWQDGRGNLPEFDGRSVSTLFREQYGRKVPSGYGMATHLYNIKKELVPRDAVSLCTIADYVGMVLTGRKTPLIHISQAAAMGLYDHNAFDFYRDTAAAAGINPSMLPPVTARIQPLGCFHDIPVSISLGDNQASFLGSVSDGPNTILANIGTGSQISVLSEKYYEGGGIEARPLSERYFLLVGAALCGGASFATLETFFREYAIAAGAPDIPQYEIMKKLLREQSVQEQSWNVTTTFAGTRENPRETGSITGISMANFHPASMIQGILNGMAGELYDLYAVIQKAAGISGTKLIASGNGVRRNEALQTSLMNRFGMKPEVEQNEEEAAFGAALSSLAATGICTLEQLIRRQ